MEDAERQGYELSASDIPTHVLTDPRHRPDILDLELGHKIRRHVEVVYGMQMQHLPIIVTMRTGNSNSSPVAARQGMDWELFKATQETLHLGFLFETTVDVEVSTNFRVDRIRKAQARATNLLPTSTSRRSDLPPSIKRRLRHKHRSLLGGVEKGVNLYDSESGKEPTKTGEYSAYHPAISRGINICTCPANQTSPLHVPATGTIRVPQWTFHNATAHKSIAPPCIRKELRVIHGGSTLRHGEGLRQVLSNDAASALPSTTCYPLHARYEQEYRRVAVYLLNYTRYTLTTYRHCGSSRGLEDDAMLALYADDSAYFVILKG
ncbi:hypothetical protein EVAR_100409_1 [Eumeta japonica]|uniref:Uncharacterized protein n=1 Tax=Eumeta variegata TaxID=151549 RepID=A0A4C1ZTU5_EUMVA|nr:hypothetical protein EVAR_100409_1 [Eumeta japonica]